MTAKIFKQKCLHDEHIAVDCGYNVRVLDVKKLPNTPEGLIELVMSQHHTITTQAQEIEHLKFVLAKLRRWKFGQSSEQIERAGQMALTLEDINAAVREVLGEKRAPEGQPAAAPEASKACEKPKDKPVRRKNFPDHFEVSENVIAPPCQCEHCGKPMTDLGEPDVAEMLDVKTLTFTVKRHIRPKKRCGSCSTIVQAPAPARPLDRSYAGASLLALVLVWKYGFALPLYRQCQIFAHAGLKVSRSTLVGWVAGSSALLGPLVEALARHVLAGFSIHGDDTPVKVLAPGTGKTKKGHLWTYVRDGTNWGSTDPPAVWYRYSPSWHGEYPQKHLEQYRGHLQADGYPGFNPLFVAPAPNETARVIDIRCWAHGRRGFHDLYVARKCPTSKEALERIGVLYDIEDAIRGQSPEVRRAVRQEKAVPLLEDLHRWMSGKLALVEKGSDLAKAFNYLLKSWPAFLRYTQDGRLEIDNNSAERALRGVGTGRKNYLFFGADSGGEHAAIIYSLIETCKRNRIDPQRYLEYVLERIAQHPINRIEELLPWNVAPHLKQPEAVTAAMAA